MVLIEIKKVEDCFDGSVIFEYFFDQNINEKFMKKLAQEGNLSYFPDFKKPFFKIFSANGLQIKGIIGENNFEVVYPLNQKWEKKKRFERDLLNYISRQKF